MDLYSLLGVARDASLKAIRSAFRQKVKTAHPDVGGDPIAFGQLLLAHDVLVSEDRRARYDESGDVEQPIATEDYLRQQALSLLSELLHLILTVDAELEPNKANLITLGTEHLEKSIDRLRLQLASVSKAQARARAMRGRFAPAGRDQPNIMDSILNSQNNYLDQSEANIRGQIAAHDLAIEILQGHHFNTDMVNSLIRRGEKFFRAAR